MKSQKVIVAPLNWGLGHASRCIPIIKSLFSYGFTPVIASDGKALQLLQKEFSDAEFLELPSYNITYKKNLKWNLLLQIPTILRAVKKEQKTIRDYVQKNTDVVGVISDNRFGVRSSLVSSVYITHQLTVLSGFTTFFTSKIHQRIIKKFDECWVPDTKDMTFSGELSNLKKNNIKIKYIRVLSRFKKENLPKDIDYLAIVSGVESARKQLDKKLTSALKKLKGKIVIVSGRVEGKQQIYAEDNITYYNFALSDELEKLINSSKTVICRSGYSSIMDLAVLHKKAILIPTKNQTEQEYLAEYLSNKNLVNYLSEDQLSYENIEKLTQKKGLKTAETFLTKELFSLFNSKRKL